MRTKLLGILLLLCSVFGVALYGAGNHGHFMFRPHMLEDWIIWGLVVFTGTSGIYLLIKRK